ncbi:hypothetical protein JCM8097_008579 [Rhodosporidiobolus ruineniae]
MSRLVEFWLTPTLTLSCILEAEQAQPSLLRFAASWILWFRPALLKGALQYELEVRGGAAGDGERDGAGVVGAGTLRVVDYALFRQLEDKDDAAYRPAGHDATLMSIANAEGLDVPSAEHDLLDLALSRVLHSYAIANRVADLAATPYPEAEDAGRAAADESLKELWSLLRPDREWPGLVGKHWQELGFQNTSPLTDFRGVGLLGLHSLLHFARTYGDRAAERVDESVGGGERWYPLALASLHMTRFALELVTARDLQLFLLRSLQTPPSTSSATAVVPSSSTTASLVDLSSTFTPSSAPDPVPCSAPPNPASPSVDITPFLQIASDLLLLFHAHWRQSSYTVMDFETVSKSFQSSLRPWIRRGVLDGRALGWERWDEGGVKLE